MRSRGRHSDQGPLPPRWFQPGLALPEVEQVRRHEGADCKRLKDLEAQIIRLKELLAEQVFENHVMKDVLRKNW